MYVLTFKYVITMNLAISGCQDYGDYIFDAGPDPFYNLDNWDIYKSDPSLGWKTEGKKFVMKVILNNHNHSITIP